MLESDYPYTSGDEILGKRCKYDESKTYGTVDTWSAVSKNEETIAAALYQQGPLTVSVNAKYFQNYYSGILSKTKK